MELKNKRVLVVGLGKSGLSAAKDILANRLSDYRTPKPQPWRNFPSALITPAARLLLTTNWFVRKIVLDTWFLQLNRIK